MRLSWHKTFLNITAQIAARSTCERLQVGAILVKDTRIISMGYNGVPSGHQHCIDYCKEIYNNNSDYDRDYSVYDEFKRSKDFLDMHYKFSVDNEIHAEMNAILYAAKNGVSTEGTDLYVSYSPCINCAKSILQAGIKNVYYSYDYDRGTKGTDFLESNGVECTKIS